MPRCSGIKHNMRNLVSPASLRTSMSNIKLSPEGKPSIGLNLFREGVFAVNVQQVYNGLTGCQILAYASLEEPKEQAPRFGSLVLLRVCGGRPPMLSALPDNVGTHELGDTNIAVVDAHLLETHVGLRGDDDREGGTPLLDSIAYIAPGDAYVNEFAAVERPNMRLLVIRALGETTMLDVVATTRMLWSPSEAPLA